MALLNILRYPDPRLHTQAAPIKTIDATIKKLAADMAQTMYAAPGIGLAATQVNQHVQLVVIDISEDRSELLSLVNPEVLELWGEQVCEEGCLSVPGVYEKVSRAERIRFRYQNLEGKIIEREAEGLLAVCVQHEIDHLKGRVFVQHLSQLKQTRIKSRLAKQARVTA